jgi:outer membrane protein assembly factor BamC
VKPATAVAPVRLATLALTLALAGCSSTDGLFGSKVDYQSGAAKTAPLEVPPDLTQLAKDSRFQPQGGVISAAAAAGPRSSAAMTGSPSVAVSQRGDLRIERQGQARWLVVPGATPEQLWPQIKTFWTQRGFELALDDAAIGVMETGWTENRAKLPNDIIRNTLGRVLGRLYDTGERDLFRTRVERTPAGTEIFIVHRALVEEYTNERKESTAWRARSGDAQLEAEFLSRMMLALGAREEQATVARVAAAPDAPARARALNGRATAALEVDEPFERAWRRVGLALDRSGFSVEDRDRAGGLYYVRYVDPATAGAEEAPFWRRWFGGDGAGAPVRYRIAVQGTGEKTTVSVLTSAGQPETGANAQRIVGQLVSELR